MKQGILKPLLFLFIERKIYELNCSVSSDLPRTGLVDEQHELFEISATAVVLMLPTEEKRLRNASTTERFEERLLNLF